MIASRLLLAAPAFLVAIVGLSVAGAGRTLGVWPAILICLVIFALGLVAGRLGDAFLPSNPKAAVVMFTVWSICPGIAAAMAIALIIYLNVTLDADAIKAVGPDKEMLKTTIAAVTALLTASFIKLMDDADEGVVGKRVNDAFFAKFKDSQFTLSEIDYPVVLGTSKVEKWVFECSPGDIEGWGWRARWRRASEIAKAMADDEEKKRVAAVRHAQKPPNEAVETVAPAAQTQTLAEGVPSIQSTPHKG